MRRLALAAGLALVALAFAAATRVADTRAGLVAEIITLLGGMAGVGLLIYAFAARRRIATAISPPPLLSLRQAPQTRSSKDLLLGASGIGLAIVLLSGLVWSAGFGWALIGAVLLLPMISGSVYLCLRFLRTNP